MRLRAHSFQFFKIFLFSFIKSRQNSNHFVDVELHLLGRICERVLVEDLEPESSILFLKILGYQFPLAFLTDKPLLVVENLVHSLKLSDESFIVMFTLKCFSQDRTISLRCIFSHRSSLWFNCLRNEVLETFRISNF